MLDQTMLCDKNNEYKNGRGEIFFRFALTRIEFVTAKLWGLV